MTLKEGEKHLVTIFSKGNKGDGMTKIDGMVVFIPNTIEGETVDIEITSVLEKVAFGKVI